MSVVLDASAALAAIFLEPGGSDVSAAMGGEAVIGAVNLAEVATKLAEEGYSDEDLAETLAALEVLKPPFDERLALMTGRLRQGTRHLGLSLGDRACLALALVRKARVMTADKSWARLDLGVEIEVIR